MTNKEWLATLTAEQFYDEWKRIERQFCFDINTRLALIEWLNEKHDDAKPLLKEQEAVKPNNMGKLGPHPYDIFLTGYCPKCGTVLLNTENAVACGKCGQAVKWE